MCAPSHRSNPSAIDDFVWFVFQLEAKGVELLDLNNAMESQQTMLATLEAESANAKEQVLSLTEQTTVLGDLKDDHVEQVILAGHVYLPADYNCRGGREFHFIIITSGSIII